MKKIISSLLIIVGFLFILAPFANSLIIRTRSNTTQQVVKEVTAAEIQENDNQEAIYEYEAIKDIEITSTITGTIEMKKEEINKNIIGQIIIDDLNIDLPILKGVSNSNLLIGAGTMVPDLVMGKGNYSLAGHYMKDGLLFGKLIDIEIGTTVKLTNKKIVYEYIIYDTQIVPDTSLYMLNQSRAESKGKPIISLMSCYYTSKNGKRFFALGELVKEYPYEENLIIN